MKTKELITSFKEHRSAITQIHIFSDDVHFVTCSKDRYMFCWDLKKERRISGHAQKMGSINSIAVANDQVSILSVGGNKSITAWDIRQADPLAIVPYNKTNAFEPKWMELSHDNSVFAVGGTDETVNLFEYKTMKPLSVGEGHSGIVNQLKFSPDDKQLVSVGTDGCVLVWNLFT